MPFSFERTSLHKGNHQEWEGRKTKKNHSERGGTLIEARRIIKRTYPKEGRNERNNVRSGSGRDNLSAKKTTEGGLCSIEEKEGCWGGWGLKVQPRRHTL